MKKTVLTISLVVLSVLLSSWGSKGHKKISQNFATSLPAEMSFLNPTWTLFVANHASDADSRKTQDPNESPRHYIDIDNYPEFILNGKISQEYDTVVAHHGAGFVIDQGTLPWATVTAFDSLTRCFMRGDWNRSAYFAADLGHYVGDGHMPLHITKNYNGQLSGQLEIHSRYESTMISKYEAQLVYTADAAHYIPDVKGYVFDYLYFDYKYVDSVLLADTYATTLSGSVGSTAYYQALWAKTGNFTIMLMKNASTSLGDLIYTAWVKAGSPRMYPNAIDESGNSGHTPFLKAYPNPVSETLCFTVKVTDSRIPVVLKIYDSRGNMMEEIVNQLMTDGSHTITCNVNAYPSGIYYCKMTSGKVSSTQQVVVLH
ncbi:MAG: T9SS type A sorting domain-containing protein [Bacteroidales bacterium]